MTAEKIMSAIQEMQKLAKARRKPLVFVTCEGEMCQLKQMRMGVQDGILTLIYSSPWDDVEEMLETQVDGKRVVITDTRVHGRDVDGEPFEILVP